MIRNFCVPGVAVGKQSVRVGSKHAYMPPKTAEYMARVRRAYLDEYPNAPELEGALGITIIEYRTRPKHHYKVCKGQITTNLYDWAPHYCSTKPDLSNLTKAVEDAIESKPKKYFRGCYANDAQIAFYGNSKQVYKNRRDMEPWIEVTVWNLTDGEET